MDPVFRKTLSATDSDTSGSHGNGISVPRAFWDWFGSFSPSDVNPSLEVSAVDENGREWSLTLYWYNTKLHGTGTRNEMRLAGQASAMLRALALSEGDTIEFLPSVDGKYRIQVVDPAEKHAESYLPRNPEGLPEGAATRVTVNRYERNRANRDACLELHGVRCCCCDMKFSEVYGDARFDSLIQAHHLLPVSQLGRSTEVNPETDMVPVCPTCHVVIHSSRDNPLTVDEVRRMVRGE